MLGNKALIVHVFDRVAQVTGEIVVTVKSAEQTGMVRQLLPLVRVVLDDSASQSPLVGFLTGLRALRAAYVFVAPCDTPFIVPDVIRLLRDRASEDDGAISIGRGRRLEPLCAIYRRDKAIRAAQKSIESERMSMLEMLDGLEKLARVPTEDVQKLDPHLLTFRNINTAEDFAWAERMIQT